VIDSVVAPHFTSLSSTADLLAALASSRPAPAGGAASALAGAMAGALLTKVARWTLGRERYAACQEEMRELRDRAEVLRSRLLALADADTHAILRLMESYSLPKGTEEEKAARFGAIQRALRDAAQISLEAAAPCTELIELAAVAAERGNRNAVSDAAVAAMLAHAGLRAAALNMRTNLQSLRAQSRAFCGAQSHGLCSDEAASSEMAAQMARLLATGDSALARALRAADPGG
jgi:formiminotetrahydrofolate cyclodeaminase